MPPAAQATHEHTYMAAPDHMGRDYLGYVMYYTILLDSESLA
jgi:hypothetical protein